MGFPITRQHGNVPRSEWTTVKTMVRVWIASRSILAYRFVRRVVVPGTASESPRPCWPLLNLALQAGEKVEDWRFIGATAERLPNSSRHRRAQDAARLRPESTTSPS
jgi:hypothetical protein